MCSDMTVEKRPLVGLWVDGELWKILNTTFYRILDWKGRQVVWPDTRGVNGLCDARRRPRLWPSPCWKRLLGLSRLKIYWVTILNGALKHGIRTCNWDACLTGIVKFLEVDDDTSSGHWAVSCWHKKCYNSYVHDQQQPASQPGQVREQGNCENDNERRI